MTGSRAAISTTIGTRPLIVAVPQYGGGALINDVNRCWHSRTAGYVCSYRDCPRAGCHDPRDQRDHSGTATDGGTGSKIFNRRLSTAKDHVRHTHSRSATTYDGGRGPGDRINNHSRRIS